MATRRLVSSSSYLAFQRFSKQQCLSHNLLRSYSSKWRPSRQIRLFTNKRKHADDDKKEDLVTEIELEVSSDEQVGEVVDKSSSSSSTVDEDPFGVHFADGEDGLGPERPPIYKRDAATGRLTGEIEQELSEEDKRMLKASPWELDRTFIKRFGQHWKESGLDESGQTAELNKLGERVRQSEMGLNVLGRSAKAQASEETLDDGSKLGRDDTGFSQILTKPEFKSFSAYMKKKHKIEVDEEDLPVQEESRTGFSRQEEDPDSAELSLKWLTARAQRQMDATLDDNPYSDLMPGDLSPTRLVNRKTAKPLPIELLHHNNIPLLQRYMTPTSQIQNRVQSRLGARDQRKIRKLIKRARNLGLIPTVGQFKTEQHGWIHAKDIHQDRDWEEELVRRGLVIKRPDSKKEESE